MMKITDNALLSSFSSDLNAGDLNRWTAEIIAEYQASLITDRYRTVFRSKDLSGKNILIGAVGRSCGISVRVSKTEILGELDVLGKPLRTVSEAPENGFETIPFQKVFEILNVLYSAMKEFIGSGFEEVPVYGGIESIILSNDLQRIADYAFPEIAVYGNGKDFRSFRISGLSGAPLPHKSTACDGDKRSYKTCRILEEKLTPEWEDYRKGMEIVLEKLRSGELQKIVISRMDHLIPEADFDPSDFCAYLENRHYQEYFYDFRHGDDSEWVGISPSVIMKQANGTAVTRPLAGTRKKTADAGENEQLVKDLLASEKDRIEHDNALYYIYDQLNQAQIGDVSITKNKGLLETSYTYHLESEISTVLNPDSTLFDVIGVLYPPATVWGIPIDITEKTLPLVENFRRGFYSGVYGYWTYAGSADTAAVIRSCRIENGAADIFAGGGIIRYSVPEEEFGETVSKMSPIRGYFEK